MKRIITLVMSLLLFTACSNGQLAEVLEPSAFAEQLKNAPDGLLLDVRTPQEFASGHLEGARNEDWNAGKLIEHLSNADRSAPIFVYCLSGGRSSAAANELRSNGFKKVYELQGGILSWRSRGLPETTVASGGTASKGMSMDDFRMMTQSGTVLVDFYAPWCAPCKKMEPALNELSSAYEGKARIVRIDIEQHPELAKALQISAIPRLQLYNNQTLVWDHNGFADHPAMEAELKKWIKP